VPACCCVVLSCAFDMKILRCRGITLDLSRKFRGESGGRIPVHGHRDGTRPGSGPAMTSNRTSLLAAAGIAASNVARIRTQCNRSCIGDRVWILPDGPAPRRTSASKARPTRSSPRSRRFAQKPQRGPSSSARSAKTFYSVELRDFAPCRAYLPASHHAHYDAIPPAAGHP
jgi:hypothetical protein